MATKSKLRPEFLAAHASIQLITVEEVAHLFGVSKYTIWRRIKNPDFPQPIRTGKKCTRWSMREVTAYIEASIVTKPRASSNVSVGA